MFSTAVALTPAVFINFSPCLGHDMDFLPESVKAQNSSIYLRQDFIVPDRLGLLASPEERGAITHRRVLSGEHQGCHESERTAHCYAPSGAGGRSHEIKSMARSRSDHSLSLKANAEMFHPRKGKTEGQPFQALSKAVGQAPRRQPRRQEKVVVWVEEHVLLLLCRNKQRVLLLPCRVVSPPAT